MFRNLLSGVPYVLLNLRAPEGSAGGGSAADTCPEPSGDTPELKHSSALSIIKDLWGKLAKSTSELKAANDLLGEGSQSAKDLKTEKDEHKKTKDLLVTAQSDLSTMTGDRDSQKTRADKEANEKGLITSYLTSKGFNVEGVLKSEAVKDGGGDLEASGESKSKEYLAIKSKEDAGQAPRGSAGRFYRKHKKEIEDETSSD